MKLINLLPKYKQEEFKYEEIFHNLVMLIILSLISFALVFLIKSGIYFYLKSQVSTTDSEIQAAKQLVDKNENGILKTQIQTINNTISDYNTLAETAPKWSTVIKAFVLLPPDGVQINSFTGNFAKKTILISGISPTRELVIQLYNNILQDSKEFYNIDYPLENVVRPTNVAFHFSFKARDELFK